MVERTAALRKRLLATVNPDRPTNLKTWKYQLFPVCNCQKVAEVRDITIRTCTSHFSKVFAGFLELFVMSLKINQHTIWFDMTRSTLSFPTYRHTGMLGFKIAGTSMARNSKPGNTTNETKKHALSHLYPGTQRSPKAVATLPTWLGTLESAVDDLVCAHLRSDFLQIRCCFIGVDGWLCLNYFWNMLWI